MYSWMLSCFCQHWISLVIIKSFPFSIICINFSFYIPFISTKMCEMTCSVEFWRLKLSINIINFYPSGKRTGHPPPIMLFHPSTVQLWVTMRRMGNKFSCVALMDHWLILNNVEQFCIFIVVWKHCSHTFKLMLIEFQELAVKITFNTIKSIDVN